jgi:hypothetical protein
MEWIETRSNRTSWSSGYHCCFVSVGIGFKPRPGDRLFWLSFFVVLFSSFRRMPGWYLKFRPLGFLPNPFNLLFITGIYVSELAVTPLRKLFLRTQAETTFQNLFFSGIGINNITPLRPNFGSHFAFRNLYQKKSSTAYNPYSTLLILVQEKAS